MNPLQDAPVIFAYTRQDAIDDGVLIDTRADEDYREITEEHFGDKTPVLLTHALAGTIIEAVEHPRFCNDYKGVLHDIFWMAKMGGALSNLQAGVPKDFEVIITGVKVNGRVAATHVPPTKLTVAFDGEALTFGYASDF